MTWAAMHQIKSALVAALTLFGWYLVYPPTARDLDIACKGKSIGSLAEIRRCDILDNVSVADAPLNKWMQVGEFDTVEDCHAQLNQNLHPYETRSGWRFLAESELKQEGELHPSTMEIKRRASAMANIAVDERVAGRCVASDDPRLK